MTLPRSFRVALPLLALLSLPVLLPAQPPPVKPNPQAPNLNLAVPLGMQRGSTLELTLTGSNLAEPTALWTSFPARVTFPTDKNNGKDPARLRVRIEVPADAPIGFHRIRLATRHGLSNFRVFCIDDLPQVTESGTNRSRATAQVVPVPVVVVGRTDSEASGYFRIAVQPGQRLSFDLLGRRLGGPIDPQLSLIDARTQKEIDFSNDAPGLQTDARLTHTFAEGGEYLVEVRDVTYRGGGDYWYRLRIGDFPCATAPVPMAARRGTRVKVAFAGPSVADCAPVEIAVPSDPAVTSLWLTPRRAGGQLGWPVLLAVSDLEQAVEREPNNDPAHANRIPLPGGVTGRFEAKGDIDHFVFAAKKGQRYVIRAHTHEYFSPAEVYMVLKNTAGKQLAATNPAAEPVLDFTAAADGDVVLSVEHLNYWGGPEELYYLTVAPYRPDFTMDLGIDRYDVPRGGVTAVPVQTVTRRDFGGPIDVGLVQAPAGVALVGQVTTAAPPKQPAGYVYLEADATAPLGPAELVIQGKGTVDGKPLTALADVRAVVSQELSGLPFPPPDWAHRVGVTVTEKPPFLLAARFEHPEGLRGQPAVLTITAARAAGFDDEIALASVGLPANVAPALKPIPRGKSEVKVQLNAAANAALGEFLVSFTGTAKHQKRDVAVTAPPVRLSLVLPFELTADPPSLKLTPGAKARLKVSARRKAGFTGPITLVVRNLPPGVTAAKAEILAGQPSAEVVLTAAANASPAEKNQVNVLGSAPSLGNQQNATPNLTLKVAKK